MNKKLILSSLLCLCSALCYANIEEQSFTNALKNCASYSDSGSVKAEGMNIKAEKNILGWQDNKCVYKEKLNFAGINAVTTCKFTKSQIDEIVSVTNAYYLLNNYSSESIDTTSLDAVKENPVVKIWNNYLQDNSTCTVETN